MKIFTRSKEWRMVTGLCGGLGKYFDIDPVLFRIAFIAMAIFSLGGGIVLYIIASLITPSEST